MNGNNPYTNPTVYAPDYSVIDTEVDKGVAAIGASMQSLEQQRKLAYEDLKSRYAEYNDATYLERAKGLDEEQNNAIRESVKVNMADFSRMSEYEKQRNISYVKDVKQAQIALASIADKARNAHLAKNTNQEYIELAGDILSMENISVKPAQSGIGFSLEHKRPNGDVKEYSMSELLAADTALRDATESLNKVDDYFLEALEIAQKDKDVIIGNRQQYDYSRLNSTARAMYERMDNTDKEIYFAEKVDPYGDFSPSIKYDKDGKQIGKLSREERIQKQAENEAKLIKHIEDKLKASLRESKLPEPPKEKTQRGTPSGSDVMNITDFTRDFWKMYASGNVEHIIDYVTPAGMTARIDKNRKELVLTKRVEGQKYKEGEGTSTEMGEEVGTSGGSIRERSMGEKTEFRIPLYGDKDKVAKNFYYTIAENSPVEFLQYVYNREFYPTMDEVQSIFKNYGYKGQFDKQSQQPIPTPFPRANADQAPTEIPEDSDGLPNTKYIDGL